MSKLIDQALFQQEALTFDDVLLVPGYSDTLPKETILDTQLTRAIPLKLPLLSAAMDTVTESALAIALAQEGGIGILHKNMTVQQQAEEVLRVKKFASGVVRNPVTVGPDTTVQELHSLRRAHNFSGFPVVEGGQLLGIVTNRDMRFEVKQNQCVRQLMTPKDRLVTVRIGAEREEIVHLLHKNRIEKLLVVDDNFRLSGMITVKDILNSQQKPQACKDAEGQLRVGAAVGVGEDAHERITALIAAGVDVLVVDTAHGHSQRVLDCVVWIKKHYPDLQIIAGNIATAEAAKALAAAGVDGVKVGIGPGSICTTRIVAGVGVPQVSAIFEVAHALKGTGIPVIADGGVRFSGDVAKALAAGASSVMLGSLFAGTEEAPGTVELYQGRSYKTYRGMGSVGAMAEAQGSSDRYFQDAAEGIEKLVPEGIEGRVPCKGSVLTLIYQLMGGLRASMGYLGCVDIPMLHKKARFVRVTAAGMRESHVHDVIITKEAPNYWMK